jgi:succinate dehydrogenase/fumarate reductase flavoprotein subunit
VPGHVTVAGAGMGGLVAAARLRQLGMDATVHERGDRAGGSMRLSSGVIWRHRSLDDFRAECPGGDVALQSLLVERLDAALDWLESLGAPVVRAETGNPRTVGRRFAPEGLTAALERAAGDVRLGSRVRSLGDGPTILATGGFGVALARRLGLPRRAAPWSEGDGFSLALAAGAAVTPGIDEFYGRALPAPPATVPDEDFVRASQVYGRLARVFEESGGAVSSDGAAWHENDLVQRIARLPGGRAWFVVGHDALDTAASGLTIGERIDAARAVGGTVVDAAELPFPVGRQGVAVHVTASVTHTIGGIAVDTSGRVLDDDATPIDGLYAAGVDAGGMATGGYASGLASALVLGLAAAEAIAAG